MTRFYSCDKTDKKILRVYMVLGDAFSKLETYSKVHNLAVSVHPKKHHTSSNAQSRHDLSCDGVSLSIG